MPSLVWDDSVDAWVCQVRCPISGWVRVLIKTDGEDCAPTERQLATVSTIEQFTPSLQDAISADARRYAEEHAVSFEDLGPDDFRLKFFEAVVPRLRESSDCYVFLAANSEIDVEHGVACLVKNAVQARVCHTDDLYEEYDWDETNLLDSIMNLSPEP